MKTKCKYCNKFFELKDAIIIFDDKVRVFCSKNCYYKSKGGF